MFAILLATLLWLVLALVGLFLLVVAAVLFLPITFHLRLDTRLREDEDSDWGFSGFARWAADVRWGGWLFSLQASGDGPALSELIVRVLGIRVQPGRRKAAPKPSKPEAPRKRRRPTLEEVLSYAREGLRLAKRLVAALRLRLRGDLTFGFPDPAVTGMVLAILAITGTPGELRLHPDWFDPGLEGWAEADGRIYGYEIAAALWTAYWRSPLGAHLRERIGSIFRRTNRMTGGRTYEHQ